MDTTQTIDRLDSKVTAVTHDRSYTAPRYSVTVLGELIHLYIDSPHSTVADYLQNVPEDATYLVGFEGAASDWWWGHIGGSPTREGAEALLGAMADGNSGKAFIAPVPER